MGRMAFSPGREPNGALGDQDSGPRDPPFGALGSAGACQVITKSVLLVAVPTGVVTLIGPVLAPAGTVAVIFE